MITVTHQLDKTPTLTKKYRWPWTYIHELAESVVLNCNPDFYPPDAPHYDCPFPGAGIYPAQLYGHNCTIFVWETKEKEDRIKNKLQWLRRLKHSQETTDSWIEELKKDPTRHTGLVVLDTDAASLRYANKCFIERPSCI